MDPDEALNAADGLIDNDQFAEASDSLVAYFHWRMKGGYQPTGGDIRFEELLARLGERASEVAELAEDA